MTRVWMLALTVVFAAVAPAAAQRMSYGKAPIPGDNGPPAPEVARYDQRLGNHVPLDLEFYDHNGQSVRLGDLVGGKPTILVLAYYRCPKLCNQVLTGLLDSLRELHRRDAANVAGGPFNVVTVSIDPREAPTTLARPKRLAYLEEYDRRPEDRPGWWFLSASHGQGTDLADADRKIHQLADAVGFRYALRQRGREYVYQPDGSWETKDGRKMTHLAKDYDYAHASGVVFLAPDGKVTSYLLGINYQPDDVQSRLREAAGGKVGSLIPKSLAESLPACFVYDQVTGRYRPTMLALSIVATPVMLLVLFVAYRAVRQGMRETPLNPGDASPTPTNG
jgi:protein SCO1/2